MKINCDVCNKHQAFVFCPADDAALCAACDHRVHHANIVAGKHPRFSLLPPSPTDSPLCDICQDKKALLFCQQDRAILCKDCDAAIHKVNEHTTNHSRFLLTGVKLSSEVLSPATENGVVPDQKPVTVKKSVDVPAPAWKHVVKSFGVPKVNGSGHGSTVPSCISDYLIEPLPGWHVEDFLDSPPIFTKVDEDNQLAKFWDEELRNGSMNGSFSLETMGIWVPQAPPPAAPLPPPLAPPHYNSYQNQFYSNMGFESHMINGSSPFFAPMNLNTITRSNGKREFDGFTVPQISTPMTASFKRSRTLM
ncbi:hypothetical protein M8C21_004120 [Ambrosia artemisiifolia]|uniref:B box-type domain-containing protein n=1 Tax=Ambrosia artemisiifolia TaxID=4212 RepID=A0AAD5CKU6_AMBAR|nr:hypothetical protein M8C21_004120 [Ambrosia artemisiifolia]